MGVSGRVWIEAVDTNNLVICTRSQVLVTVRKAHTVNSAGMRAYSGELFGLCEIGVARPFNGFCGPDSNVGI